MLPIHRKWRQEYKKREALWKRSCSISHNIFCSCPSYTLHFDPRCRFTGGTADGVGGVSPADAGLSFITEDGGTPGGDADPTSSQKKEAVW
nr:MAG: ORF2 [Torque teno polar bear virus 18]